MDLTGEPLTWEVIAPNPRHAADLRWYFSGDFRGDLGITSNIGPLIEMLRSGVAVPPQYKGGYGVDDKLVEAATRFRSIRRRLERLSDDQIRVLSRRYTPVAPTDPHSLVGLELLGEFGAVTLMTVECQRLHKRSKTARPIREWLGRLCQRVSLGIGENRISDRLLVTRLKEAGRTTLMNAHRNYEAAKSRRMAA
jgi:hypothetical protein